MLKKLVGLSVGEILLVAVAGFLAVLFLPRAATAKDLDKDQAIALYMIAISEMGVGIPDVRPIIHTGASLQMLRDMVCPQASCSPNAVYSAGRIFLLDGMDFSNPYDSAVLVHELVHHIQAWKAGGPASDCEEYRVREAQAHEIEEKVLSRLGADARVARSRMANIYCR